MNNNNTEPNSENSKSNQSNPKPPTVKRGSMDESILRAALHLDPDAYGLNIQQLLQKVEGRDIALPNIYATLKKLNGLGLLEDRWTEPRPERGGRTRHVFQITSDGRSALSAIDAHYQGFHKQVLVMGGI